MLFIIPKYAFIIPKYTFIIPKYAFIIPKYACSVNILLAWEAKLSSELSVAATLLSASHVTDRVTP